MARPDNTWLTPARAKVWGAMCQQVGLRAEVIETANGPTAMMLWPPTATKPVKAKTTDEVRVVFDRCSYGGVDPEGDFRTDARFGGERRRELLGAVA